MKVVRPLRGERREGPSYVVKQAAAGIVRLLLEHSRGKPEMAVYLNVSPMTVSRAIEYLRDRGVPVQFSRSTMLWSLPRSGIDWSGVTLGEAYRAGLLPETERWILAGAVQEIPAPHIRRRPPAANLKRSLLK